MRNSALGRPRAPTGARWGLYARCHRSHPGKATQHIEAEISVYDSLDFDDKLTVLEALDGLAADANDEATRH